MQKIANSRAEFLELIEADSEAHAKKMIYKGTDCGAWINFEENGVSIGSIVEGVDIYTQSYELNYPIYIKAFWNHLDQVETEAKEIWDMTHGCEDCGPENDLGYITINPDCESCEGYGVIL